MVIAALRLGKPVITANKALISAHGEELFATARQHGANLYYEASVAGGIPIIKVMREAFVGNHITHLYGIVNGTCNYILSRMKQERSDFSPTLAETQKLGYAEADSAMTTVDGFDSLHKTGILASLAHGFWANPKEIHLEGIRSHLQSGHRIRGKAGLHHQIARGGEGLGRLHWRARAALQWTRPNSGFCLSRAHPKQPRSRQCQ